LLLVIALSLAVRAAARSEPQERASTSDGLHLLQNMQRALGGVSRLDAIRDFEEIVRAEAWDSTGSSLGAVSKRTRWRQMPPAIRLDQRGPRGTYVLYYNAATGAGWEILPDLTSPNPYKTLGKVVDLAGGELEFARSYLTGFPLMEWRADRIRDYVVTARGPRTMRIATSNHATDFTLDSSTWLPLTSAGVSLADPNHPVPAEARYQDWQVVDGVLFPRRRVNYHSGVKRGDETTEFIAINSGLRSDVLQTPPQDFAPDLPPVDRR
jgi:hypothetical protein